ncbi:DUF551 domain-containing protein, partial [Pluralibacter sp.]|uniref:DUF551 domain-containing protein n=1 Tax=Pluralibacter sp. TaxID=1920032 RepID=UPI0025E3F8C8
FDEGWNACRAAMLNSRCSIQTTPELDSLPKIDEVRCCRSPVSPDGWIPVSERMPEPNIFVLVSNGVWVGLGFQSDAEHLEEDERWQDEHYEFIDRLHFPVTHWMPLPATPQQDKYHG